MTNYVIEVSATVLQYYEVSADSEQAARAAFEAGVYDDPYDEFIEDLEVIDIFNDEEN